jgi:hypothetical protein
VEVTKRLELAGPPQRAGVDRAQAGIGDHPADGRLCVVGVGGDEDVEGLACDPAIDQGAREGGVKALTTLAPGALAAISCAAEPISR